MNYNLHTHTYRCHHASETPEEYVLRAIECGVKYFGFSDHVPLKFHDGTQSGHRVYVEEAKAYCDEIKALAEKYSDKIEIHVGFEAEFYPEYIDEMIAVYEGLNQEYTLEEAFYNISNRNNIIEEEKKIEECIKSLGFTSCYAEVEGDDYIKVIVYSETKSLLEVDQIMYQVQLLLEREVSTFIVEFQD